MGWEAKGPHCSVAAATHANWEQTMRLHKRGVCRSYYCLQPKYKKTFLPFLSFCISFIISGRCCQSCGPSTTIG